MNQLTFCEKDFIVTRFSTGKVETLTYFPFTLRYEELKLRLFILTMAHMSIQNVTCVTR